MDFLTVDTTHVVEPLVVLGVDTHADTHVAVALDGLLGRRLGSRTVSATDAGYAQLVAWAEGFGRLDRVGVEGSGSFGVGLARFLTIPLGRKLFSSGCLKVPLQTYDFRHIAYLYGIVLFVVLQPPTFY